MGLFYLDYSIVVVKTIFIKRKSQIAYTIWSNRTNAIIEECETDDVLRWRLEDTLKTITYPGYRTINGKKLPETKTGKLPGGP